MNLLLRPVRVVGFGLYFVRILIKSNWQVAIEALRPRLRQEPRIVGYDVAGMTDRQIFFFSSAITLTPGTLVIDLSEDGRTLYVHCMFGADRADILRDLDDLRHRLLRGLFT